MADASRTRHELQLAQLRWQQNQTIVEAGPATQLYAPPAQPWAAPSMPMNRPRGGPQCLPPLVAAPALPAGAAAAAAPSPPRQAQACALAEASVGRANAAACVTAPHAAAAPGGMAASSATKREAVLDLSTRRCEQAFDLIARSRRGAIDRPLLEAVLQMLGLRLTTAELDTLLAARHAGNAAEAAADDVHDLVDVLGVVDALRQGGPGRPKPPAHSVRYQGDAPWSKVDPVLILPLASVNHRRIRTQPRVVPTRAPGAAAASGAAGVAGASGAGAGGASGGGGSGTACSRTTGGGADPAPGAACSAAEGRRGLPIDPLPHLPPLTEDEQVRAHMQTLLHAYTNKPLNAADALVRTYAQVAVGGACICLRLVLGERDACDRPFGLWLLVQGALWLGGVALQLLSSSSVANRDPVHLMRFPLEAGACEFVLDGTRVLLLLPLMCVWWLVGAVWALPVGNAPVDPSVVPVGGGDIVCDGALTPLWLATVTALAVGVLHACLTVTAVLVRLSRPRGERQPRGRGRARKPMSRRGRLRRVDAMDSSGEESDGSAGWAGSWDAAAGESDRDFMMPSHGPPPHSPATAASGGGTGV